MTHLRLWRFEVAVDGEARFLTAYGPKGDWARLFGRAPGFIRTELWREREGRYLTADHWESQDAFNRFQAAMGDEYRTLDKKLEGVAGIETFVGSFEFVD